MIYDDTNDNMWLLCSCLGRDSDGSTGDGGSAGLLACVGVYVYDRVDYIS